MVAPVEILFHVELRRFGKRGGTRCRRLRQGSADGVHEPVEARGGGLVVVWRSALRGLCLGGLGRRCVRPRQIRLGHAVGATRFVGESQCLAGSVCGDGGLVGGGLGRLADGLARAR